MKIKVLILLLFIALILGMTKVEVLIIQDDDNTYFIEMLESNSEFTIDSIHSVSKTLIKDTFIVTEGMMIIIASEFSDQGGAGMIDLLEPGETMTIGEESFIVNRYRMIGDTLLVLIDEESKWQLNMNHKSISNLKTNSIKIKIKKLSIIWKTLHDIKVLIYEN